MSDELIFAQISRLKRVVIEAQQEGPALSGARAQVTEFLRQFAGPKSSFYALAQKASGSYDRIEAVLLSALDNFEAYVSAGLAGAITPERRAQLDVVSDFLEQAQALLTRKGVHPAAPIVLIGATLEEFLRTWVENAELTLGQRKPSLDSYAQTLFAEELITKQDVKDITSWGGLRNHAAHGEWEQVADKSRASLMLEGVNLFLRKYEGK
tara:strand:+ start:325 stop:954 length:630 start_codon:yes stop_codon:yes gene_type:complete